MPNRSLNSYESIHGSTFLLALKLFLVFFVGDLLYFVVDIFFLGVLQSDLYSHIVFVLTIFHLFKSFVQISLVFVVVFHWLYHKYHIDYGQKKLYEHRGFFHTRERMSDLRNVRDVVMEQDMVGKMFHYGDIVLTITASGGYVEKVVLKRIQDPELYIDFLENCGT